MIIININEINFLFPYGEIKFPRLKYVSTNKIYDTKKN